MRIADEITLAAIKSLGHMNVAGLPCAIEHPKGSMRILKGEDGKTVWKKRMYSHYGFIKGTKGRDSDEIDVMIGPLSHFKDVYVVHMIDKGPVPKEREDEDKVMVGFGSEAAAKQAFFLQYPKNFFGGMTTLPLDVFKQKLKQSQLPHREKKIHGSVTL